MRKLTVKNAHKPSMTEEESNAFLDAIADKCDTDPDFGERLDTSLNLANRLATAKGIIVDLKSGEIILDLIKN